MDGGAIMTCRCYQCGIDFLPDDGRLEALCSRCLSAIARRSDPLGAAHLRVLREAAQSGRWIGYYGSGLWAVRGRGRAGDWLLARSEVINSMTHLGLLERDDKLMYLDRPRLRISSAGLARLAAEETPA